jgi:hypothetical protein
MWLLLLLLLRDRTRRRLLLQLPLLLQLGRDSLQLLLKLLPLNGRLTLLLPRASFFSIQLLLQLLLCMRMDVQALISSIQLLLQNLSPSRQTICNCRAARNSPD